MTVYDTPGGQQTYPTESPVGEHVFQSSFQVFLCFFQLPPSAYLGASQPFTSSLFLPMFLIEVVIKCKTLPRWFAGTRALDGGCCEQKVSRYCRYVYQYGKIGPSEDPDDDVSRSRTSFTCSPCTSDISHVSYQANVAWPMSCQQSSCFMFLSHFTLPLYPAMFHMFFSRPVICCCRLKCMMKMRGQFPSMQRSPLTRRRMGVRAADPGNLSCMANRHT